MKLRVSILALLIGLVLPGCNRGHLYFAAAEIGILAREIDSLSSTAERQTQPNVNFQGEIEIITSADALAPIISKLNLNHIWARRLKTGTESLTEDQALEHLRKILKFDPTQPPAQGPPYDYYFRITARSEVPQEAADIANAVADRCKTMRDEAEKELEERGISVLRDKIAQQEKIVPEKEAIAAKNPQDLVALQESRVARSLLDALNIKLKQDLVDETLHESPVVIISRAVAPPE